MDTDDPILKRISPNSRAFFVIIAGIVLQFTYGLVYTFGNLLPYLASYLRWKVDPQLNDGTLIWFQSLLAGFPFAFLVGGYLEKVIGARWGAALGSLLYTGGVALSYFAIQKSYFSLFITLGIFAAFGHGVAYNCVLTQCQKWLPHRVGLVSGLITAGFGSGAFIMSPIQTKYINPNNLNIDSTGYFTQPELLERVPKMFLLLATIFGLLQFFALFFIADPKPNYMLLKVQTEQESSDQQHPRMLEPRNSMASCVSYATTIHYNAPTNSKTAILCSDTFLFLFLTLMLNDIWVQTISGFYKEYGQTFIHDDFFLATINSFAAVFNTFSRISWGAIADKFSYQFSMSIACTIGAMLMWTLGLVKISGVPALYFIWICAMFCCVGGTFSLVPYAAHRCFGSDNFGFSYGCLQMAMFLAGVLNALLSQFLLNIIGFQIHFTIIGGTMFLSLLLTIFLSRTQFGQLTI